jgi:hypothetical protein
MNSTDVQALLAKTKIGQALSKEIDALEDAKRRVKIDALSAIEAEFQTAFARTDAELKKAVAAFHDAEAKIKTAGERLIAAQKQRLWLSNAAESKRDKLHRELDEMALGVIATRYQEWEAELGILRQRKPVIKWGPEVSAFDRKPVHCFSDFPAVKRRIEALSEARQALSEIPRRCATEAEAVKAIDALYASLPIIDDQFVEVDLVGEPLKRLA